jgi:tetratricopeptide (TPR) repeat protein
VKTRCGVVESRLGVGLALSGQRGSGASGSESVLSLRGVLLTLELGEVQVRRSELEHWEKVIRDPTELFRASEAREALAQILKSPSLKDEEKWRAQYLVFLVASKQGQSKVAMDEANRCLELESQVETRESQEIDSVKMPRILLPYHCAKDLGDVGRWQEAADMYEDALRLAEELGQLTEDQRLGLSEKQAHALHEAGRYEAALAVNFVVIDQGRKLFGVKSDKLLTAMTNAAENLYQLKKIDRCAEILGAALEIAIDGEVLDSQFELLFRLAYLNLEAGEKDVAIQLFEARMQVAEAIGNEGLMADAQADLEKAKAIAS